MKRIRVERIVGILRKNAVVSLLGNGTGAFLGLVTLALLARWLPKEEFGKWTVFLTTYTLFETVRMGLLLNALIRYTAGMVSEEEFRRWVGATWQVGIAFTLLTSLLLVGLVFGFPVLGKQISDPETVVWFVAVAIITLPSNMATWFLHARSRFLPLQVIRVAVPLVFLSLFSWDWFNGSFTYNGMFRNYFIANGSVSVLVLLAGWSRWEEIRFGLKEHRRQLIAFGKYSIGTLLISNLLRSADVFLLSAFLGPAAVAFYAIPQRFIQLLDTPVRSIVVTDIPRLAELHRRLQVSLFVEHFQRSAGRLWMLLLPVSLAGFVLAEPLVTLLGGTQYRDGALILRLFMIQGALIPLERYSGIGLDAIGQPQANLTKVLIMLVVTVSGDLLALYFFQSVAAVAFVSILTFCAGLFAGFWFMGRYISVTLTGTIQSGWKDLSGRLNRIAS